MAHSLQRQLCSGSGSIPWGSLPVRLRAPAIWAEGCIGATLAPDLHLICKPPNACELGLLQGHAQPLEMYADAQHHAWAPPMIT